MTDDEGAARTSTLSNHRIYAKYVVKNDSHIWSKPNSGHTPQFYLRIFWLIIWIDVNNQRRD